MANVHRLLTRCIVLICVMASSCRAEEMLDGSSIKTWPNGVVPYEMDSSISDEEKAEIQAGLDKVTSSTCIKFKAKDDSDSNYITFMDGASCTSHIGMIGSKQTVTLNGRCRMGHSFQHVLLHSVGVIHMHQRWDSHDFIKINWENVNPGAKRNFQRYKKGTYKDMGMTFSFNSVMNYPATAFSKNGKPTIEPLTDNPFGELLEMTAEDVKYLNKLYQCPTL